MMSEALHIVIPAYNEGENITRTLAAIEDRVMTPHRVLIVYDFDGDSTVPAVDAFVQERRADHVSLVKNRYGAGALNAIRTGFDAVEGGVVLVTMADTSDDLSVVDAMMHHIDEGYDIVCGSRYMKGGGQTGGPRTKRFLSRAAGVSFHALTGIPTHDITNSFKMYRKSVLDSIRIESSRGFEIGMEVTIKAFLRGYRVTEVPSCWRDRVAGESRFKLMKWLPAYLRWYVHGLKGRFLGAMRSPRSKAT